ncbi:hypothetical protein AB1Y20_017617 [Prymnesium parvum]|uniref:DUF4097 domain-containing protein n=1 Tax=Prymnesium parvum TaxID=97485 RepID=A0AB34JPL1_PRYPA
MAVAPAAVRCWASLHGLSQRCSRHRVTSHILHSGWRMVTRQCVIEPLCMRTQLSTRPHATLHVTGTCASLTVKTNMESDSADVHAEVDSVQCQPHSVSSLDVSSNGDITLRAANPKAAIMIEVPAAFNVKVAMEGDGCNVALNGWLEGDVDISTECGQVDIGTVKGVLTRARTRRGNLNVATVDGNLDVESCSGKVTLGKVLGEEVRAVASGGHLHLKAVYAKRVKLSTSGEIHAAVLAAESGVLHANGDSKLSSLDGSLDVWLASNNLEVQAGEQLRRLRIVGSNSDVTRTPRIKLHLPSKLAASLKLYTEEDVNIDEKLDARRANSLHKSKLTKRSNADRTPSGASAFSANEARAMEEKIVAELNLLAEGCKKISFDVAGDQGICCAIEAAAPRHNICVLFQDFFARFRLF